MSLAGYDSPATNEALWSPPPDVRAGLVHSTPRRISLRGARGGSVGKHARTGTVRSSVFNLTNTILGSGTLAMPYGKLYFVHSCLVLSRPAGLYQGLLFPLRQCLLLLRWWRHCLDFFVPPTSFVK